LIDRLKRTLEAKLSREIRQLRPAEAAVMMLLRQTLKKR
jgi:hypothetical protein